MYYKLITTLKGLIIAFPKKFFLLFALLVLEGIVLAASVIAVIPLADFILDNQLSDPSKVTIFIVQKLKFFDIKPSFVIFGSLFVVLILVKALMAVFIRYSILKIKYSVIRDLTDDAFTSILKARWDFFSETHHGEIANTFNKELVKVGDSFGQLANSLAYIVQMTIYLVTPFILNPKLTLFVFLTLVILIVPILILVNPISYKLGKKNIQTSNEMLGVFIEVLQGIKIVIGYGKQDQSRKNYLSKFDKHIEATLKSQILSALLNAFFQPLGITVMVVAMGFVFYSESLLSELAAIFYSLLSTITIMNGLLGLNVQISNFLPSYEQVLRLTSKAKSVEETQGNKKFEGFRNFLKFNNVSFDYISRSKIIKNFDLEIKKGDFVALVGKSGAGKSTITDLLLGLLKPTSGQIIVDNVSISELDLNSYRSKISYVPQDSFLFHTTIEDNLKWASEKNVKDEDLWDCLELANAKKFVELLPKGIHTTVGDRGVRLSGGQRQRIALARAFIRKPELLILDEATSALDSESEILIQESLKKIKKIGKISLLIIAHRLSTIKNADMVYVIEDGKVLEKGQFNILTEQRDGAFKRMLEKQEFIQNKPIDRQMK